MDLRMISGRSLAGVDVQALVAVGLHPGDGLLIFLVVVDFQSDAPGDLGHVHPLGADAQVLLEHAGVAVAARDAMATPPTLT